MSWIVDTRVFMAMRRDLIGPGRLILVVGPSGAGKDTLIRGARAACAGDLNVVFPRRVVTRQPSVSEDHDTLKTSDFRQAVADGAFALWWEAHGHCYGIPSTIDDDIRCGRTVVCNMSRTIVDMARRRYARVAVVLITAPQEVLEKRLVARDRSSDGNVASRISRTAEVASRLDADFVIHNAGKPEVGIRRLLNAFREAEFFIVY